MVPHANVMLAGAATPTQVRALTTRQRNSALESSPTIVKRTSLWHWKRVSHSRLRVRPTGLAATRAIAGSVSARTKMKALYATSTTG